MFGKTHTEELNEHINKNAPKTTDEIKKLYDAFDTSNMVEGVKYYGVDNKINERKIYTYQDEVKVEDKDAINSKIPSGFHKILVDQKVAYLVGEPMVFGSKSDNKPQLELLEEIIGEQWEDTITELVKGASNKGKEWLHVFVNEDGDFDYMVVPAENFIPIYDYSKRKKLAAGIRFYSSSNNIVKFEVYDEETVTYYEMIDSKIYLDANVEVNPAPHFTDAEGISGMGWGKVPFICFLNNGEELSDLHFYKETVDNYDFLVSDAQNTLLDMQALIFALRGYEGESLAEFMTNLKRYKAVNLDENGGIDTIRAEVPVEAYKTQSDTLKENVFMFGQGVNPSPDIIGNAPSGVALENLYSLLDMKASMFERKATRSLREFMWFIQIYCELAKRGQFDYRDVTFTFNKLLLTNESEIIDMAQKSMGMISQTTILENHPWVKDVAQELKRLESDAKLYGKDLGSLDEDETEEVDET
ncbi:phage portal protein [Lysinibacillus xylanilyticus]|uniref:phage portal protein n=1 Tax=Lysinibacillus xylanilyticus TaxID=582475 RepID=UPI003CFD441C